MRHKPEHSWPRGKKWRPKWLVQSAAKYNTVHTNNKPDPEVINADPPLLDLHPMVL